MSTNRTTTIVLSPPPTSIKLDLDCTKVTLTDMTQGVIESHGIKVELNNAKITITGQAELTHSVNDAGVLTLSVLTPRWKAIQRDHSSLLAFALAGSSISGLFAEPPMGSILRDSGWEREEGFFKH